MASTTTAAPYDGSGRGRGWPLLTGERGHYELAAGRDPLPYLEAMTAMASPGGMLPEQVWDADPIPSRRLEPGRPTGSAMPLVWAHAEFIKLMVSRHLGHPVDRPRAVWRRYQGSVLPPGMRSGGRMRRSAISCRRAARDRTAPRRPSCIGAVQAGTMPQTSRPGTAASGSTSLSLDVGLLTAGERVGLPGNGRTTTPGTAATTRSRYCRRKRREGTGLARDLGGSQAKHFAHLARRCPLCWHPQPMKTRSTPRSSGACDFRAGVLEHRAT